MLMPGFIPKSVFTNRTVSGKIPMISIGYRDRRRVFKGDKVAKSGKEIKNSLRHGYRVVTDPSVIAQLGDIQGRVPLKTPQGDVFTLSISAFALLMKHADLKSGVIKEECAFGWMEGEMHLLPFDRYDSLNEHGGIYAQFHRSTQLGLGHVVEFQDLKVGCTYRIEGVKGQGIYLGIHDFVQLDRGNLRGNLESTKTLKQPIFKILDDYEPMSKNLHFRKIENQSLCHIDEIISKFKFSMADNEIVSTNFVDPVFDEDELSRAAYIRKLLGGYTISVRFIRPKDGKTRVYAGLYNHLDRDLTYESPKPGMSIHYNLAHAEFLAVQRDFSNYCVVDIDVDEVVSYLQANDYKARKYKMVSGNSTF